MNANRIENQFNLSFSAETANYSLNAETASKPSENNAKDSATEQVSTTALLDRFEFSGSTEISRSTYEAPTNFQLSKQTASNRIIVRQSYYLPQGNKQLEANINQQLMDFFGADSSQFTKHQDTLSKLKDLDPELAQKAMFLITLMGREEADKFLNNMSKFVRQTNEANTSTAASNVIASASATANVDSEQAAISKANSALEGFTSALSAKLDISINFSSAAFIGSGSINTTGNMTDPLVFDLAGDGIDLTTEEDGVDFDIDGDGAQEHTAFIQGDDALLYLDKTGNGIADDGRELFGDQQGAANGYAELAKYDENADGTIDEFDAVYKNLRLWQDKNSDGYNQLSESMTLLEAGIKSIQLKYHEINEGDGKGNATAQASTFTRLDESTGYTADMLLRNRSSSYNLGKMLFA